ncbi:ubiquitin carrier protein 7 [Zea mays]|uniref:Ubiquitin carrier protein 7 n=1 Tax=Zea mays TaxID=4577 RepID=A0A1D6K7A4_MAIZE|nr:ubiquitin carrier protein 7 [Zea mays]ONL99412.1 ubiquitin carrier protein 7 [Zea mays]
MSFPQNYPNSPPSVRFTSEMWHPNGQLFISDNCIYLLHLQLCFLTSCIIFEETPVYPDGWVCISILHPPSEDPNGYELASERWTPVHTLVGTDHSTFNSTQIVHVSFSHHDLSLGHCVCGQRVLF